MPRGSAYGARRLAGASPIIWDLDFTPGGPVALTTSPETIAAAQAYLSARGASLTRASAATVQTSASTVYTAIGVDQPRVGLYGLVVEEARTNRVPVSRDRTSWTAGGFTYTADYAVSPDGTAMAPRNYGASGGFGRYVSPSVSSSTTYIATQWARRGVLGVASSIGHYIQDGTTAAGAAATHDLTDSWARYATPTLTTGGTTTGMTYSACEGRALLGLSASARDAVVDFAQVEAGKFATEAIITTGAAATRAADKLSTLSSRVVRDGRIGIELEFTPKAATLAEQIDAAGWNRQLHIANALHYTSLDCNTGKITVSIGGSFTTGTGLTHAAGDTHNLWIEAGGGSLVTRIVWRKKSAGGSYGAATVLGTSGAPQGAHTSAGNCHFMADSSGNYYLTSWLQRIRAYAPGRRPAWAA